MTALSNAEVWATRTRQLGTPAGKAWARARRDRWIRLSAREGSTVREIAAVTRLSGTQVRRIMRNEEDES